MRGDSIHDTDRQVQYYCHPINDYLIKGRTPLHYAAAIDRVDICYLLLNRGADATQEDSRGKTPLDYALTNQNEYAVALFTCHTTSIGDFTKLQRCDYI